MNRIALSGNPNIGKTTIFNALTGANQKVGNWPGVTVHRKEGNFTYRNQSYSIVDLPGSYSLGSYSEDEKIATDYILTGDADLILNVVDATNLERNLYLTMQLLEMEVPVVIALNMMDEAERYGLSIDIPQLECLLGVPVIPVIASKGKGLPDLVRTLAETLSLQDDDATDRPRCRQRRRGRMCTPATDENSVPIYEEDRLPHLSQMVVLCEQAGLTPSLWHAMEIYQGAMFPVPLEETPESLLEVRRTLAEDPTAYELAAIDTRYMRIHRVLSKCVIELHGRTAQLTDKIDAVVTHRYWGIPIFALTMLVVFQLTFALGQNLLGNTLDNWVSSFAATAGDALALTPLHPLLIGFLTDGLIAGIGTVLTFIPLIVILYLLLGFLEDIGYMARAAYVMDSFMRRIGLQGKTLISMIVGFGCNVPGVMSTRTLENRNDRMIAMMINPFMSCGAKIPVYGMLIGIFFPKVAGLMTFALYALGFVVAIVIAKLFSKTMFRGDSADFILELPPYRAPILKNVVRNMADNVLSFIKRATTIITVVIAMIYLLSVLPYGVEPYSAGSYLGRIGSFVAPLLAPMGNGNWQAAVGLVAGMPAKEGITATLSMIYAPGAGAGIQEALRTAFTPLSALSYLVMVLLYTPCVAVLSTVYTETKSAFWTIFMAVYTMLVGYGMAVLVFQIGRAWGLG